MLLPFPALMQWCTKRQNYLDWTNHDLADKSTVPVGTINRIKAGDYLDCKYSTIRNLLLALIGGTTDEFACTELVEKEMRQKELFEQQASKMAAVQEECDALKERLLHIDELHRQDIRAVREEYLEQIAFLKEQLRAWQTWRHE
jgi:hypothetical protein